MGEKLNIPSDIETMSGCTVLISQGHPSANRRTILVKNRDIASISSPEIVVMGKTESGNKYLGMATVENPASLTIGINAKGVVANKAGRYCREVNTEGVNSGVIMQRALQSAGNADEMAKIIQNIVRTEQQSKRGFAYSCADFREAYIVEAHKQTSEIYGPLTDTVFAHGNYALTEKIKACEKTSRGHQRAKRAQGLMEQFKGDLTVPFMIRFCRDHEHQPDPAYAWDDRNICTHGFGTDTRGSGICMPHPKYPGLLTVFWVAVNQPCKTPYVPFYVGINRIPESYAGPDAYAAFEDLSVALEENPEFSPLVRQHWEAFEFQTMREGSFLEKQVAEWVVGGKHSDAEAKLTDFVAEKARQAIADARKMIEKICRERFIS